MNKALMIFAIILTPVLVFGQTYIDEDFSVWPPAGWMADSHGSNWHASDGNEAGGTAPEGVFDWSPQFSGTSRFMSPEIDLTGITELYFEFKHMVDHYSGSYTIGVATRSGGGSWNIVWSLANPGGNVGPVTVSRAIANDDVGAEDFQICLYFSGSSYNVDYWFFDDFILYSPLDHDVKVQSLAIDDQYDPDEDMVPAAVIQNFGLNDETFDINCQIMLNEAIVYNESLDGIFMEAGDEETIAFPAFSITDPNEMFDIVVTATLEGDMDETNNSLAGVFNTYTTPREMVLVEIGTGTWCQFCPGAAMGAEDLVDNGYNVAVVEYHDGDPFENAEGAQRINYYGISGFPTAVFDGVTKFVGGSYNQSMYSNYLPLVQARQDINSAFTIEIFGENEGNEYDITARVTKMAAIPYENMVLHVALTESDIPYNWQGQTHLEWVERDMVENANGTPLDFTTGDVQEHELQFTMNPSWVTANSELSAWVQNLDNKEVLQAMKIMLPDLIPTSVDDEVVSLPLETKLGDNYPNPFNPATTINFSLQSPGDVTLEVFNIMGQKVKTVLNGQLNAGHHQAVWHGTDESGSSVASGTYFYKLTTGGFTDTRKMILVK